MKQQVSLQLVAETDIEATSCRTGRTRITAKIYHNALLFYFPREKELPPEYLAGVFPLNRVCSSRIQFSCTASITSGGAGSSS